MANFFDASWSGFNDRLEPRVLVIFDPTVGVSGVYRALKPTDLSKDNGFYKTIDHKVVNTGNATGVVAITDAPTSAQKRALVDVIISADRDMSVTIKEETSSGIMHGPWYLVSGIVQTTTRGTPMSKLSTADKRYFITTSVTGLITVETWSYSEA